MNSAPQIIHLTVLESVGLLAAVLLPMFFIGVTLWRRKGRQPQNTVEPDWSIPTLDAHANGASFFHSWNPAIKIGTLFGCCLLIVSLRTLLLSMVAAWISLAAVALSGVGWWHPLRRLLAMSGFLLMLVVILPLSGPIRAGDTVLAVAGLEHWPLRLHGLLLALTIACKAVSVALLMEPMLATASVSRTLQGFAGLGLPRALVQMVALCHRYLFVFQEEIGCMQRSMRVRGFTPRTNLATLHTMGNCFGMLFIRSFERTERIHEAMLSRGYRGYLPAGDPPLRTASDVMKGVICGMISLALLLLDRAVPAPWW